VSHFSVLIEKIGPPKCTFQWLQLCHWLLLWPTCCWRNGPSLLGSNKLVGKPCESKPKWHSAM